MVDIVIELISFVHVKMKLLNIIIIKYYYIYIYIINNVCDVCETEHEDNYEWKGF